MGNDTPLAVLSDRAQPLFGYFKQLFAQVTNPPLDAIREELVTSVFTGAGGEKNLLEPTPDSCHQIALELPVVDNDEMARLKQLEGWRGFTSVTLPMLFPAAEGAAGMERALGVAVRQGLRGDRTREPACSSSPTAASTPRRRRSRRFWPARGCTIIWSARGFAPAPGC